ncbi:hypothetical protein TRIUR3_03173 [Triticum urartu]|uniref:Uncharacterized protein n=1 Tax=Triticum urartu TaxID=4572 RepID=M7ZVS9_TRIUA|nr:hypothetical protein TRIUR3_03173 [Triticum urartu]
MAPAVAALVICSVLLPLAFLLGLHRNGVYENLCLIGPVHIGMEEAQRFIWLALRGRPKQNFNMFKLVAVSSRNLFVKTRPGERMQPCFVQITTFGYILLANLVGLYNKLLH